MKTQSEQPPEVEVKPISGKGGIGVLALANYGAQAARLLLSVLTAQLLGPAGRGGVALISIIDEASTTFLSCGVPVAAGYFAKIGRNTNQALINASFRLGLFLLPLTLAVAGVCGAFGLQQLEPAARWMTMLLIAWTGLVNLPSQVAMNLLQAERNLRDLAIYTIIFSGSALVVTGLIAVTGSLNVFSVAVAFAIGRFATALYGLVTTAWPSRHGSAELGHLLRFGLKALPGSAVALVNNRFDQLLIAPLVSLRDLGFYAVAAGTSFLPAILATSLGASSFATVVDDKHLGRAGSASAAIRQGVLVSAIASVALAAISPVIIPLIYGAAFQDAVTPTIILLVGSIPWGGQIVARQCANALGSPGFSSVAECVGLVVTIVGLALFVPSYGIIGAAVVSVVAYAVRFVTTLLLLRKAGVGHFVPGMDDVHRLYGELKQAGGNILGGARRDV